MTAFEKKIDVPRQVTPPLRHQSLADNCHADAILALLGIGERESNASMNQKEANKDIGIEHKVLGNILINPG